MEVRVESGHGAADDAELVRFWLGARCIEVTAVLDRWLSPDHSHYKLQGDDGATYVLRHDRITGLWELSMFRTGSGTGAVG